MHRVLHAFLLALVAVALVSGAAPAGTDAYDPHAPGVESWTETLGLDRLEDVYDRVMIGYRAWNLDEVRWSWWGRLALILLAVAAILAWIGRADMPLARAVGLGLFAFVGMAGYLGYRAFGPQLGITGGSADTAAKIASTSQDTTSAVGPSRLQQSQQVFQREARRNETNDRPSGSTQRSTSPPGTASPEPPPEEGGTTAESAPSEYERALSRAERTYHTFQGSGEEKTGSFEVPTKWVMLYQNTADPNSFFTIYVLQDGERIKSAGSHLGPSAGLTESFPAGTYSLHVHGTRSWTVKVLQPSS